MMYANSNDWIKRVDNRRTAVVDAKGAITKSIEAIEPDIIFTHNTIGLYAVSTTAKPTWYKAGNLYQAFLVPFGTAGHAQGDAFPLILNRYHIHRFNQFPDIGNTQYVLSFQVQWYVKDIQLQIWEYEGTSQGATFDSLDSLIKQEIAQTKKLQTSVNQLLKKAK